MIGALLMGDGRSRRQWQSAGHLGQEPPNEVSRPGRQARVLVVEDDYLVSLSNETALLNAGFEVSVLSSGEAALAWASKAPPDLVLMDIRLDGEMDGIDAAVALRALGVPSLFASAHSDPGTIERGAAASPLGWIGKPFSEASLVAAVEDALARLRHH